MRGDGGVRPVPVVVVGVGSLGQHHARLYAALPEARLVAVVDRDPERARAVAARHGAAALTDLRDLPDGIEAASVAVPTSAHAEVAAALLDRGVAVLVEKPIAASLAEAEEMTARARRAGRSLLVGHTERFNPALVAVRPRIRDPRFIEAHRLGVFTARSTDIDVVLDLMIHDLDVILSLVPAPLAAVDAVGVHALTDRVDIANARLRFESGCVANITASRISTEKVRKVRIFQSDSYISLDYAGQSVVTYTLETRPEGGRGIRRADPAVERDEPLGVELRSFLRHLRGDASVQKVTAEEGVRALRTALQILERMRAG